MEDSIQYTMCQVNALAKFDRFLENEEQSFGLSGSAGTGKTVISCAFLKNVFLYIDANLDDYDAYFTENLYPPAKTSEGEVKHSFIQLFVVAPTNKAKRVIRDNVLTYMGDTIDKYPHLNLTFLTVTQLLNKSIVYDKDGEINFKCIEKNNPTTPFVFLDEVSMISKADCLTLMDRFPETKFVWIGDRYQLPPVKESVSYIFTVDMMRCNLKEVVRAKSNHLREVFQTFRDFAKTNQYVPLENEGITVVTSPDKFVGLIESHFDVKTDKIIAYRNKIVDKYNTIIRKHLFGSFPNLFCVGERLMARGHMVVKNERGEEDEDSNVTINNCDELEVLSVAKTVKQVKSERFECYDMTVRFSGECRPDDPQFNLCHVTSVDQKRYTTYMEKEKKAVKEKVACLINGDCFRGQSLSSVLDSHGGSHGGCGECSGCVSNALSKSSPLKHKKWLRKSITTRWESFYSVFNLIPPIKYSYAMTVHMSQGSTYKRVFVDHSDIHQVVGYHSPTQLGRTVYTAVSRASEHVYLV